MSHTESRLTAVRACFADWEVDGLLITSAANRRWLSGFTGSAGQLLVTADRAVLVTDFRYWEQASAQAPAFTLHPWRRGVDSWPELLREAGIGRLGIEGSHMSVVDFGTFGERMADIGELVVLDETVEPLRAVKSAAEIAAIRAAAAITDAVMAQVPQLARPGRSERAVAWDLEKGLREAGADGPAFDIIVASGPNAALPHHRPGDRLLQPGDALIVDMGAARDGYRSDLSRSFHLGAEPSDRFLEIYRLAEQAHTHTLAHLHGGMTGQAADALARDVIRDGGHGDHFGHGLGHGVGLEIHEAPGLSSVSTTPLPTGAVVTVEPGIYLPGWGGVRLEDLVLLTETGLERLSHCPHAPIISIT